MLSPECSEGTGHSGILVNSATEALANLPSDEWIRASLPPEIWRTAYPLLRTLRERNPRDVLLDWHFENRADIRVADLRNIGQLGQWKAAENVRCLAYFGLPAIASDGQSALVVFDVGPEQHGRTVFCIMRLDGDKWTVAARHIREYI